MGARNMYGVYLPPWPHDPTVTLDSFSYSPVSPIHVGDDLIFRAVLNKPAVGATLVASVDQPSPAACYLNDQGSPPDEHANDGVYSGQANWVSERGPAANLPVWVELSWMDGAPGQTLDGPPLTVLPAEEEQP